MDPDVLRDALDAFSDGRTAAGRRRDISPLKGIRGVPDGEIARIATAAWEEAPPDPDGDRHALDDLFQSAFEDGIVAIGLVAATLPDDPEAAYEIGLAWLERVDDPLTADAIGALLLGPGVLAAGRPLDGLRAHAVNAPPLVRRAVCAAAEAWLPEPLRGPACGPLRARLGTPQIRFVEAALDGPLTAWADAFLRDEAPPVRKVLRRIMRTWARCSPDAVAAWADTVRGGLPKMLGEEVRIARRRAGSA